MKIYKKDSGSFVEATGITNDQIRAAFEYPHRNVYTVIQNLTLGTEIQGEVVGTGSISVNGSSALRRTISGLTLQTSESALAQDYNWVMTDEIRVFQGISNAATEHEIWYFNLGTYCLSTFSAAESVQGTKIDFSGKDKMVLLNGEQGGTFTVDTELHIKDNADGTTSLVPIADIIRQVVILAGIDPNKIHIEIEETTGRELLEYRGSTPMYIYGQIENNEADSPIEVVNDFTVMEDDQVYYTKSEKKAVSELDWGSSVTDVGISSGDQPAYSSYVSKIYGPGRNEYNNAQYITKVECGQVAGYKVVDLTYPGELKAAAGETVVSVLDKIVNVLGKEYEYFFDVDGEFYFQKKKALLSITRAKGSNQTFIFEDNNVTQKGNDVYQLYKKEWVVGATNFPFQKGEQYELVVAGKMSSDTGIDTHMGAYFVYSTSETSWKKSHGEIILPRQVDKIVENSQVFTYNPPSGCTKVSIQVYYRKPSGDGIPDENSSGCLITKVSLAENKNGVATIFDFSHASTDDTTAVHTFEDKQLLTSLNRQPKIENIKNDFTIWGTRPSASGKEGVPIHGRYIIDEAFKYYANGVDNIEEAIDSATGKKYWKWKAGADKTLTTTQDSDIICEQLYQMATHPGSSENSYVLVPPNKEYYKQLFPDVLYFWRQIYNPNETGTLYVTDSSITSGSMKPVYWFGDAVPEGLETDYQNIYTKFPHVSYSVTGTNSGTTNNYYYWNIALPTGISSSNVNSKLFVNNTILAITFDKANTSHTGCITLNMKDIGDVYDDNSIYPSGSSTKYGYPVYKNGRITDSNNQCCWAAGETVYFRFEEKPLETNDSSYTIGIWHYIKDLPEERENNYYTSLDGLIDLSAYEDVFDSNYNSIYDQIDCENNAMTRDNTNFFSVIRKTGEDGGLNKIRSYYYRELGTTSYKPLYEMVPKALAQPLMTGDKWNSQYTYLCYKDDTMEDYILVGAVQVGTTVYEGILEDNINWHDNSITISDLLSKDITGYREFNITGSINSVGNNGQFYLLSPVRSVMYPTSATYQGNYNPTTGVTHNSAVVIYKFKLQNYHKYGFYLKKEESDGNYSYSPWIKNWAATNKNTWRIVTGYNATDSTLTSVAALDTLSYNKAELYRREEHGEGDNITYTYHLLTPPEVEDKVYVQSQDSTADKIVIGANDNLFFTYYPCDWKGNLKTTGVVSQTKKHPVFASSWEYNAATGKRLTYERDPALLPFALTWITPQENDELNNCLVSKIGLKTLVKNEKSVTSLDYDAAPAIYFTTEPGEEFSMTPATEKLFVLSSQGISATEYLKNLLFEHSYCNETASVSTIPLYFLEPNNYIEITEGEKTYYYILSQFSIPLSYNGTMNLTLTRDKLARAN